jgi:hypothetical protein
MAPAPAKASSVSADAPHASLVKDDVFAALPPDGDPMGSLTAACQHPGLDKHGRTCGNGSWASDHAYFLIVVFFALPSSSS